MYPSKNSLGIERKSFGCLVQILIIGEIIVYCLQFLFSSVAGLSGENESKQVNTLLYCMGGEADHVLFSTDISEDDRKRYNSVIGTFDTFFKVTRNIIFERARFNRRNQIEGESAEQCITQLYQLAENCEYPSEIRDEMTRDRLVVDIKDAACRKHCNSTLTSRWKGKEENTPKGSGKRAAADPEA